ncbi:hypothetical protein ES708_33610 [subsurface metagenome]
MYKPVYKWHLIFIAVDGSRFPVIRVPYIAHVRTGDILLKHKWTGTKLVAPLIITGFYHFRRGY